MTDAAAESRAGADLMRQGRPEPAAAAFRRALDAEPDRLEALINLGAALLDLDRLVEAEPPLRRALELLPHEPTALANLAIVLQSQERYAEALALADAALAAGADHAAAWLARGNALAGVDRHAEALEAFHEAVTRGQTDAVMKVAQTLGALGRFDEALAAFELVLRAHPDDAQARLQSGMLRLQRRDFAAGWADYEARWRVPRFVSASRGVIAAGMIPELAQAPKPEDLAGQRVLLMGEQGLGDQVMFASMVPDLARIAAQVTLVCDPRLARLFAASFPQITVSGPADAKVEVESIDRLVAIGSLGSAFRRTEADFPGKPYLAPSAEVRERWAARLGPKSGRLRIGLAWRGGLPRTRREARSLALADLAPLLALPGVEFISLQHGDVGEELAAFPAVRAFPAPDTHDLEDLAGLAANLDLVVSVQTALVHLCGALGTECLAMVPPNTGWRYMTDGERVPWYGSVRLFRQADPGAWAPVIEAVARELSGR